MNPIDLSPNYAGTIMSIGNGAGALTGILAPYSVGLLTPHVRTGRNSRQLTWRAQIIFKFVFHFFFKAYLSEWRLVFWITFIIHILKTIIYQIWGSGDVQSWNANKNKTNESHEMSMDTNNLKSVIKWWGFGYFYSVHWTKINFSKQVISCLFVFVFFLLKECFPVILVK